MRTLTCLEVYVFGPTYLFDGDTTKAGSKAIGLVNPANDCFINSILQALAGLPDLRKYLIREVHRRRLDGPAIYRLTEEDFEDVEKVKGKKALELESLRQGSVTKGLKDILDKLNERPIYKKTISAQDFIRVLELAFRTRISRQQQDAQEFLQVVVERVCDEYHAGRKARRRARQRATSDTTDAESRIPEFTLGDQTLKASEGDIEALEEGFPFEGKLESQIECETCGFKPQPTVSSFVTLTLNVPQKSNTTLNQCFDGMLKVERIEDYKCDKCRLDHALRHKSQEFAAASDAVDKERIERDIQKIQTALEEDPENPPADVELPDLKLAPKRRIRRHMRISSFPKILAIHLSRSVYSATNLSTKNTAKVAFPESLPIGGILDQHKYRLLCVVTHKGGHDSGHYETFRRQVASVPFSTPTSFGTEGVYSNRGTPVASAVQSPRLSGQSQLSIQSSRDSPRQSSTFSRLPEVSSLSISSPHLNSPSTSSLSSRSSFSLSSRHRKRPGPTSAPRVEATTPSSVSPSSIAESKLEQEVSSQQMTAGKSPTTADLAKLKKKQRKANVRWWRISDDRVKESSTGQVLGMQKEVYLLFYELDQNFDEQ